MCIGINKAMGVKEQCGAMLKKFDGSAKDWQLGHTKVFMRESLETVLERTRQKELRVTVMKIQAVIVGYIARKRYKAKRKASIRLQSFFRMLFTRLAYNQRKKAAITLQSHWRGYKFNLFLSPC
jgi:myosin X